MTTTPPPMPEALRLAARLEDSESPRLHLMPEAAALLRTQHERITALEADRAALKAALEWVIQYFEAAPEQLTNAREWLVAARAALRDIR